RGPGPITWWSPARDRGGYVPGAEGARLDAAPLHSPRVAAASAVRGGTDANLEEGTTRLTLAQTLAASGRGGGGASLTTFLLPVLLILVFWLLLIRPQRKRQREMAEMQQRLQVGQEVMTGAGIMGTIQSVDDDIVVLELSPGVTARFVRQAIMRVVDSEQ